MENTSIAEQLKSTGLPAWELLPDFGLYMDQLTTYVERCFSGLQATEIISVTPATINYYVKCGLIDRPRGKKYTRDSLAQLLMVCVLKQTTSVDTMTRLLHPGTDVTTEAMYSAFRASQAHILADFSARCTPPDPLTCALEAATWQMLCREALDKGGEA